MVTCYDPDGTPHQMQAVDARECCQFNGYTMTPPREMEPPVQSIEAEPLAGETVDPDEPAKRRGRPPKIDA